MFLVDHISLQCWRKTLRLKSGTIQQLLIYNGFIWEDQKIWER